DAHGGVGRDVPAGEADAAELRRRLDRARFAQERLRNAQIRARRRRQGHAGRIADKLVSPSATGAATELARVERVDPAAELTASRDVAVDDVVRRDLHTRPADRLVVPAAADLVAGVEGPAVVADAILPPSRWR